MHLIEGRFSVVRLPATRDSPWEACPFRDPVAKIFSFSIEGVPFSVVSVYWRGADPFTKTKPGRAYGARGIRCGSRKAL